MGGRTSEKEDKRKRKGNLRNQEETNKQKIQRETKQEVKEWMQGQCRNKGDEDKEREARRRY